MSDIRFTPTTYQPDPYEPPIRIDRPEYNDVGNNLLACGWCFAVVREIDTPGHTGWHRALSDQLWRAAAT